ncbi:MAG: HAD family hydrolase [Actinomycetota bacterium]|nr:HAD-IB family hydrolase [Actinomycetota bacterium]
MQAAFFDLDKTIIARSSTLAFGRPLYKEGFIGRGHLVKGIYAQLVYLITGADEDKMEKMRAALLELTRGWDKERLSALVQETLSEIIDPIIYAEAMDLVEEHLAAGRRVYIVSSSGEEIVLPLARYLGIPYAIATKAMVEDGKYTGELEFYCYGDGKREAIEAEAAKQGIDLAESYAYSDSITDLPMLAAVGHPQAVNPDKELRAEAEARGWPIVDFTNPISVRRRLRQRGAELAERGSALAERGSALAERGRVVITERSRDVAQHSARLAREVPRAAQRRAQDTPRQHVAFAALALAAAVVLGWAYMRRQRSLA